MEEAARSSSGNILRRFGIPLLALVLGLVAWLVFRPEPDSPPAPVVIPPKAAAKVPPPPPAAVPPPVDHPVLTSTSGFQSADSTPEEDLEIVNSVLGTYRRVFKENPVGENEEIFAALRGRNPQSLRFLPDGFPGLQESGVVNDRWGTPWRFHALSGQEMEILSAGPDRQFGTDDDLASGGHP